MAADANWTTICPHCGAASEDDAICRACGKLLDESQPIRPFSLNKFLSSCVRTSQFSAQVRNWQPANEDESLDNLRYHPSYAFNPGNIHHKDDE